MAAGYSQTDVLSRVRREQRMHGKVSDYSGLRILLTAIAITVAILLFAFGAAGMLFMARSPQEPIVSKLETPPMPPLAAAEPESKAELQAKPEADVKMVKTQRIVAPASPPAAELPQQKQELTTAQQPSSASPDPEPTAAIPNPQVQQQQVPNVQQNVVRPQPQQHHAVRRPVPDSQRDNPLYQMFGIKQYR